MTTAEHVKIVNDVSLSQRPTLPAARDKARASSASRDLFRGSDQNLTNRGPTQTWSTLQQQNDSEDFLSF